MAGVLSSQKAEPTDPIRGVINDVIDIVGFPRPEEALGTPADLVHQFGLPTVKEWLPMPVDINGRVTRGLRRTFPMPGTPRLPNPMAVFDFVGFPGEGLRDAAAGGREARSATGAASPSNGYQ
jgi:hypothetical protein